MTLTAIAAVRAGRVSVVDVAWGWPGRRRRRVRGDRRRLALWLLVALVGVWGVGSLAHLHPGPRGHGGPPLRGDPGWRAADVGVGVAIRRVFLVQGAVWLVSLPSRPRPSRTPPGPGRSGSAWRSGPWRAFETVGDAQLNACKRDPDRGPVMDRGCGRGPATPNYFGDSCVWWGVWLVGGVASGWLPGLVSLLSPVAMTVWLVGSPSAAARAHDDAAARLPRVRRPHLDVRAAAALARPTPGRRVVPEPGP